ncbi:cell division cycle 20 [Culex quinquefasciatus]|uniref:Cell division cycle 20 n=1 Tax=Culex quinquefasciatus TaxID=7176 RepID=B0X2Z0_CULQU|nr:cell division cycle 20 [Culex quinquefasciatus]|eukprot:XP_001864012.1 cell division cycle 20 [Culex quinquefasciatus]
MFSPDYEKRILKHCSPVARSLFNGGESSSSLDRFIPCRANNNWQTNFASLSTKSNENSPQSSKKQRDCGETARDSVAYSCLLKNELLGTGIEDVKSVAEDKIGLLSNSNRPGLFKYQSPTKQAKGAHDTDDTRQLTHLGEEHPGKSPTTSVVLFGQNSMALVPCKCPIFLPPRWLGLVIMMTRCNLAGGLWKRLWQCVAEWLRCPLCKRMILGSIPICCNLPSDEENCVVVRTLSAQTQPNYESSLRYGFTQ